MASLGCDTQDGLEVRPIGKRLTLIGDGLNALSGQRGLGVSRIENPAPLGLTYRGISVGDFLWKR
jgi:hypothetical protein